MLSDTQTPSADVLPAGEARREIDRSFLASWLRRPIAGGPAWRFVWPAAIAFTLMVQAVTGMAIWMYYSAGAQSAWESVYYLQYHVADGWLVRALHFYAGQAMLVLIGIYVAQMVLTARYVRRTLLFWTVLLMALVTLGLNLTGDLLSWDQNSYWAATIRIGYLTHTPLVGPWLSKLAVGGPQLGTFTLTRFLAIHVGLLSTALVALIFLHGHFAKRDNRKFSPAAASAPYWPRQAARDAVACFLVMAAIAGLALRNGANGPDRGIELGAPANPVEDPGTARPEWSFRGLYQLHENMAAWPELISIHVIPGLIVLAFFAMPLLGRRLAGRVLNAVVLLGVLGGAAALSWQSYAHDAKDDKFRAALEAGRQQAEHVKELIMQPSADEVESAKRTGLPPSELPRIPVAGALTLLQGKKTADNKLQQAMPLDPRMHAVQLFNQFCASCHDVSGATGVQHPGTTNAADLAGFAGRAWLTGFMTENGIGGPKYFGNTKFAKGTMYGFVKESYSGYEEKEQKQIVLALSHEAELKSQKEADTASRDDIAEGVKLIKENCSGCHAYHAPRGDDGKGPKLTGYGSRAWLVGMISNPAHEDYYGKANDRMQAYHELPGDSKDNVLSQAELELLADWLRGEL